LFNLPRLSLQQIDTLIEEQPILMLPFGHRSITGHKT